MTTPTAPTPTTPTLGLRHAVLWVRDPATSAAFYEQALGLVIATRMGDAIFMTSPASATDHDLGLFRAEVTSRPASRQVGMYHLAWEVATLSQLADAKIRLREMGAYIGESDHGVSRSLYAQDPDGLEFEVMWEVPEAMLSADEPTTAPLDLEGDMARFGAERSGRGVV